MSRYPARVVVPFLMAALCAPVAYAQSAASAPSPASEAYQVFPEAVPAGAKDFEVRLVANSSDLFRTSSMRQPKLSFGAGIELVSGSFKILSPSEAVARVNNTNNVIGGIETKMTFYSIDGATATRQERATLGVVGPFTAQNTAIEVSVGSVRLVRVNVDDAQTAGDIVLDGKVNGNVTVTPPVGTLFAADSAPQAFSGNPEVSIANPHLAPDRSNFSFSVVNPGLDSVNARISGLSLDTSNFGTLGGILGNLSSGVSGTPFATGTVLVVNAHTALEALMDSDIPEEDRVPGTSSATNNTNTTGSTQSPASTPSRTNVTPPRRADDRPAARPAANPARPGMVRPGAAPQQPGGGGAGTPPQRPTQGPRAPANPPPIAGGPAPATGGGGGSFGPPVSDAAPISGSRPRNPEAMDRRSGARLEKETHMKRSNRLYFADKDFQPLAGVMLDQALKGERQATVWIVLERVEDPSPAIDTVVVQVRFGSTAREVMLTETGPRTGVFRCSPAGIQIVAAP